MANSGNYGLSLYGLDPYGSEFAPFGVAGATSYNPHFVQVRFTDLIDLSDLSFLDPSNYVITPTLNVHLVILESADSVILQTDTQSFASYLVTVGQATSFFGIPMVPPLNTATFTGFPTVPGYFSAATTPFRIRCIFSTQMQLNAALTNPMSYAVTDLNGHVFTVLSAVPEQSGNPFSVVLTLATPMETTNWYQTVLSPTLIDINGQMPQPSDNDFQFIQPLPSTNVPIKEFSGEVNSGILGDPDGLVFFSPSLNVAAANSVIQVEEVDVCTTAYDTYMPPPAFDPVPFYVWSPTGPQTFLEQPGVVLFAGFPRMSEAMFELDFTPTHLLDPVPKAFDVSVCITLSSTFAPGFVPLLNDPAYWLFDGTHNTTPPMWICADNLSPIPPGGGSAIIVLFVNLGGEATMTVAEPQLVHWCEANIQANSSMATVPEIQPMTIKANSYMRVGRPSLHVGVTANIVADSSLKVAGQPAPTNWTAEAAIIGYAEVRAHCEQHWTATTAMDGYATIFTRPTRHVFASAAMAGNSTVSASARVGPAGFAAMVGHATFGAVATVHHFASVSISGQSAVVAAAF